MGFVRTEVARMVGKEVRLTVEKKSPAGYFTRGSIVTIVGVSERGYEFEDDDGNRVCEAGFTGFEVLPNH